MEKILRNKALGNSFKMNKVLSVIIPFFNCENTIVDTLSSLERNNCKLFEVVLINDGSTDSSLSVINNYLKNSSLDTTLITQKNQGVSAARNKGIESASGKYIVFLDSDDLIASHYIDSVAELLSSHSYDTIAAYRTREIKKLTPLKRLTDKIISSSPIDLLKTYTFSKQKLGFTSFLYSKTILDKYELRFTIGSKYGEDFEFATKYLAHCKTAAEINCFFYYYRPVSNSVSGKIRYEQIDAIYSAKRAEKYLDNLNHPFSKQFKEYMVNRAIFSCAHRFSRGKDRELFDRLHTEFDVKTAMLMLRKNKNSDFKTKVACSLYLVSKSLFFRLCRL